VRYRARFPLACFVVLFVKRYGVAKALHLFDNELHVAQLIGAVQWRRA
jgi:hypothetical protein